MIIKGSSSPSNVESKKERSKTIFKIPTDSVTSTVNSKEPNPDSGSIPEIVTPVKVISTSNVLPSMSMDSVSA